MPDFGRFFPQAIHLLRKSPSLWWLAVLGAITQELFNSTSTFWATTTSFNELSPEAFFSQITAWGESPRSMILFALGLTAVLLVIWLVTAVANGGTIVGTQARLQEHPFSFKEGVQHGRRLLWPIVVVDTIIFFPIFIIALLMLIVLGGGLGFAIAQSNTTPNNTDGLITTLLITLLCLIPLIILTIPIGLLTAIYRYITIRDIALNNTNPRESIRRVWPLLKQAWQGVLVLSVLVIALSALPTALIRFHRPNRISPRHIRHFDRVHLSTRCQCSHPPIYLSVMDNLHRRVVGK